MKIGTRQRGDFLIWPLLPTYQQSRPLKSVAYPEIFSRGSTNSVEDRGQRERRSGGGSPLVRGSTQFANE
jgi:hypothetical protein